MAGRVRKALRGFDPIRVENPAHPGTPDINYTQGWIELKWIRTKPKTNGIVKIEHFTPQQRVWLLRRQKANGKVWLLLKVSNYWFLFKGGIASEHVGRCHWGELFTHAHKVWYPKLVDEELRECLVN